MDAYVCEFYEDERRVVNPAAGVPFPLWTTQLDAHFSFSFVLFFSDLRKLTCVTCGAQLGEYTPCMLRKIYYSLITFNSFFVVWHTRRKTTSFYISNLWILILDHHQTFSLHFITSRNLFGFIDSRNYRFWIRTWMMSSLVKEVENLLMIF